MKYKVAWGVAAMILISWVWSPSDHVQAEGTVVEIAESLVGSRYRTAGRSPEGFDCSGLTSYVFELAGLSIPRDSRSQALQGEKVELEETLPGDLIFFKGRNSASIGHVGIVVAEAGQEVIVVHACRRGVVKEKIFQLQYYRDRFVSVRRM
ncbi:MAG: C40 family peptidase [Bacteroidia bacterium]|nr:C40 family peptidase [Bacteroidia bacterium]